MEIATVAGKMNAGAARLRIVGLVLILFAFVLFIYFTRKQEQHIENAHRGSGVSSRVSAPLR